ncbi:iron complex outermembrane recepter protein [Marinobacter daqiaonensis]|uniref:Iron complex outermembrane recepter protein n=1 Tax=Marinobacter daqiaonensis TaxID=650891 RepID=A0A1I6GQ13_9GAMM|nr:TonB-dependent receptor [Marinobacter daqiaonensis]SFR44127.1 iron complex outermembrane recepter protein [Marinobacter daqiaonensis]
MKVKGMNSLRSAIFGVTGRGFALRVSQKLCPGLLVAVSTIVIVPVAAGNDGNANQRPADVVTNNDMHLWGPVGPDAAGLADLPQVLTTARLKQPKSRVPGSTTVISGEQIRDLGLLTLADVFRLVPGMTVAAVGSNQPVVSYHGTVAYEQRRLQVLIDGRTGYQPSLADVDWNAMPVPLELIDRIEISRGPNAASYGINAFLASINIITLTPETTAGTRLHAQAGDVGHRRYTGYHGHNDEQYSWRVTWEHRESSGFDYQYDGDVNPPRQIPIRDGYEFNHFLYDGIVLLSPGYDLVLRAGVTDGIDQDDPLKLGRDFGIQGKPDARVDDYYLQAQLNISDLGSHQVQVQSSFQRYNRRQDWISCVPLLPGQPDICARLNHDVKQQRLEMELQDTWEISPDFRLVSGLGYRDDAYVSETFFGGDGNIYQSRVFANLEYSPFELVTFNAGANWEYSSLMKDSFLSPRLAANLHLTDNQTLRFVYSEAVRTPDALEQRADWAYTPANVSPGIYDFLEGSRIDAELDASIPADLSDYYAVAGGGLEEERIISREISYYGQFRLGGGILSTEVRYFHDHLRNLVSGFISVENFDLGNRVALDQQGVELETALDYGNTQLRLSYGYMDQDSEYRGSPELSPAQQQRQIDLESRLTVRHSGSLAWIQRYASDWSSAVAWYVADEFRSGPYQRADLRLAKTVHGAGLSYDIALILHHYLNDNPLLSRDNNYRNRNQFFVEAGVRF